MFVDSEYHADWVFEYVQLTFEIMKLAKTVCCVLLIPFD